MTAPRCVEVKNPLQFTARYEHNAYTMTYVSFYALTLMSDIHPSIVIHKLFFPLTHRACYGIYVEMILCSAIYELSFVLYLVVLVV